MSKKEILIQLRDNLLMLKSDIQNGTCHSLDYLLSDNLEETISEKGIRIRKLFAPFMRFIYGFQSEYSFQIDKREKLNKTRKGKIFVVNHRQPDDMVFGAKAVGKSGYFVFGNPTLVRESLSNGFGLWSYGLIITKRDDKNSRASTLKKMEYILNHGGNVIIYSEGYWNLSDNGQKDERHGADDHNSENWIIQDLNIGAFKLAQKLGCEIIPTVLHYDEYKKRCYAMRGKARFIEISEDVFSAKDEFLDEMRSMYFEMMEKYSFYTRQECEQFGKSLREQWEELKKTLLAGCDIKKVGYKLDLDDEKKIGKAKVVKPVTTNEEAFEHLEHIDYNSHNAFLLSKRLSGRR